MKQIKLFFTAISIFLIACSTPTTDKVVGDDNENSSKQEISTILDVLVESENYTARDSVAAYLCKFEKLPQNYISKSEGKRLYESTTGNTFSKWNFNPLKTIGVMIGGDNFNNFAGASNYHSNLPEGRYREADVDYGNVTSRGTKRLVYQSGCIIYYTADHYKTFSRLKF